MPAPSGRLSGGSSIRLDPGWTLEWATPPSHLYCANGMRGGSDGRLYIAQCMGSQVSALDLISGALEVVSPIGGDIVGPDDIAFDQAGRLYATEVMNARVSVRETDGTTRVLHGDLPNANGITFHHGRLFIDECRPGGRLLELPLDGGAPRLLAEDLPMPNALAAGPDGKLYFPLLGTDDIWRIDPQGGAPECVVAGLGHPVAVKFDAQGFIVSPQSGTGEVLRIDPRSGACTVLARLDPGLDNLEFVGNRLFVSHMTSGQITEIAGGTAREILPGGLLFPLDMTAGADGQIYFTDNCVLYGLAPGGQPWPVGRLFAEGFPGTVRGLAAIGEGEFIVGTTDGRVVLYRPQAKTSEVWAEGLDQAYGIAASAGGAIVAERATGRVLLVKPEEVEELARGLHAPTGVAIAPCGRCFVSERSAGRVVEVSSAGVRTVCDGLGHPEGIAATDDTLFVVDTATKRLVACDLDSGLVRIIAEGLPVGTAEGVTPKPLLGFPPFSGPMGPFAGLTLAHDGSLYLSADAAGAVVTLRKI